MNVETKWRRLLPWLRKNFPARYPVRIRRVATGELSNDDGDCDLFDWQNKRNAIEFRIRINRNRSWSLVRDAVLHEWAHALSWFTPGREPHSAEWGVAYAELYRTFWQWNFGRKSTEECG